MDINNYFKAVFDDDAEFIRNGVRNGYITPDLIHKTGGHSLLRSACINDSLGVIRTLVELGADPNLVITRTGIDGQIEEKDSVALSSVKSCRAAEMLLAAGANINHVDGFGYTPLLWACKRRNAKLVRYLIEAGASLDQLIPVQNKKLSIGEFVEWEIQTYINVVGENPSAKQLQYIEGYREVFGLLGSRDFGDFGSDKS